MGRHVWRIVFVLISFNMGTSLLVPVLPLYKDQFDLSQTQGTLLFVLYVWLLIPSMYFLGQLSDQIGRKTVLIPAFLLLGVGDVLFLLSWHAQAVAPLYAARVCQGIASGAFWGTGSAFMIDSAGPSHRTQASNLSGLALRFGLSLGPGIAGALAVLHGAWPFTAPFLLHLVVLVFALLAIMVSPETVPHRKLKRFHIQVGVPREDRDVFYRFIAPSGFIMAVLDGMVLSLIPFFVFSVMEVRSPALVGLLGFLLLGTGVVSQTLGWRMSPKVSIIVGLAMAVPSAFMMVTAAPAHSVAMLLVGAAGIGLGNGLILKGGVNLTAVIAPVEVRGKILSVYYFIAYLGTGGPSFLAAVAADHWGLSTALYILAGFLAALCLVVVTWGAASCGDFKDRMTSVHPA